MFWKYVRHALGVLLLAAPLLLAAVVARHWSDPNLGTGRPARVLTLGDIVFATSLLVWMSYLAISGSKLFRHGEPARGESLTAIIAYAAFVAFAVGNLPYPRQTLTQESFLLFVAFFWLAPLANVFDLLLPPWQKKPNG